MNLEYSSFNGAYIIITLKILHMQVIRGQLSNLIYEKKMYFFKYEIFQFFALE